MGKLGDLFVHIGAKTENLEKGIGNAKNSVKGFGKQMAILTANAVANIAQIAVKFGKMALDLAKSTQIFGDAWNTAMAKAGAAFNTFANAVMNWDWDGLGSKMRSAMTGAGNAAQFKDLEFEVKNAIAIKEAALEKELEVDRQAMRNQQLTHAQRKQAAEHYLSTIKPIYEQQARYYEDAAQVEMDSFIRGAGATAVASTRRELESFLSEIANDPAIFNALYNASKGKMQMGDDAMLAGLNVSAATMDSYKKFANYYQQKFGSDATASSLKDAITKKYISGNAFDKENRRVIDTINALGAQMDNATEKTSALDKAIQSTADSIIEMCDAADRLLAGDLEKLPEIIGKVETAAGENGLAGNLSGVGTISDEDIEKRIAFFEKMQYASEELAYSLQDGLISALDELAEALAGVDGSSFGSVMTALLTPLADAAVKAGMIVLSTGEALEWLKNALANPFGGGPEGAVIAGAALIAAGMAAKIGLAAIAKNGSSAGVAASSTGTASGATNTKYEDVNINVHIEGKLKGSDIVLAARNTSAAWAR